MMRGRPFEPGNKFGRGRPPGSRNKRTRLAGKLFEDNSATLMGMALMKAREDPQMLKMLVSRIPRQRDMPVKIPLPPLQTLEDCDGASQMVIEKASAGKISWREALEMSAVIDTRCHVLESRDLQRRVTILENVGGPNQRPEDS
jgi:hypothetical protein